MAAEFRKILVNTRDPRKFRRLRYRKARKGDVIRLYNGTSVSGQVSNKSGNQLIDELIPGTVFSADVDLAVDAVTVIEVKQGNAGIPRQRNRRIVGTYNP